MKRLLLLFAVVFAAVACTVLCNGMAIGSGAGPPAVMGKAVLCGHVELKSAPVAEVVDIRKPAPPIAVLPTTVIWKDATLAESIHFRQGGRMLAEEV